MAIVNRGMGCYMWRDGRLRRGTGCKAEGSVANKEGWVAKWRSRGINSLKGPKREIFVAWIFAQIRPIWIGDLGTRPKNPKILCLGP